jgi:hypothetical protein
VTILHSLRTIVDRIERHFEQRGEAAYEPDQDPDIRHLRLQRLQAERATRDGVQGSRWNETDPITRAVRGEPR